MLRNMDVIERRNIWILMETLIYMNMTSVMSKGLPTLCTNAPLKYLYPWVVAHHADFQMIWVFEHYLKRRL